MQKESLFVRAWIPPAYQGESISSTQDMIQQRVAAQQTDEPEHGEKRAGHVRTIVD
jgi:hypothetical protein